MSGLALLAAGSGLLGLRAVHRAHAARRWTRRLSTGGATPPDRLGWAPSIRVARGLRVANRGVAVAAVSGPAALGGGLLGGWPVAALAAAVAGGVLAIARSRAAARADARYDAALTMTMDAVARSLRSGAAVRQALAEAAASCGPVAADLAVVVDRCQRGETVTAALGWWAAARPRSGVALAAAALILASEAGGGAARAVEGFGAALRQRDSTRAETRALATQARMSAVVIAVAPLAFSVLGLLGDRAALAFLLGTPAGQACLVAGLALDAAGALWMARLTRSRW